MKLYVLVKNDCEWVHFIEESWQRYEAFGAIIEKHKRRYEDVKHYTRKNRLFLRFHSTLFDKDYRDVYSVQEISIVDALNWMLAENKTVFVRQWIIDNS